MGEGFSVSLLFLMLSDAISVDPEVDAQAMFDDVFAELFGTRPPRETP